MYNENPDAIRVEGVGRDCVITRKKSGCRERGVCRGIEIPGSGRALRISVSTVKTLLGLSVKKLRERLNEELFAGFLLFFCTRK